MRKSLNVMHGRSDAGDELRVASGAEVRAEERSRGRKARLQPSDETSAEALQNFYWRTLRCKNAVRVRGTSETLASGKSSTTVGRQLSPAPSARAVECLASADRDALPWPPAHTAIIVAGVKKVARPGLGSEGVGGRGSARIGSVRRTSQCKNAPQTNGQKGCRPNWTAVAPFNDRASRARTGAPSARLVGRGLAYRLARRAHVASTVAVKRRES